MPLAFHFAIVFFQTLLKRVKSFLALLDIFGCPCWQALNAFHESHLLASFLNHCPDTLIELVVLIITLDHFVRILRDNPNPRLHEYQFEVCMWLTLISERLACLVQQWKYFIEHSLGTRRVVPSGRFALISVFLSIQNL